MDTAAQQLRFRVNLLEDVDFGSANVAIAPGGTTSSAAGPSIGGSSAALISDFTAGDVSMARTAPAMHDPDIGALSIVGVTCPAQTHRKQLGH